MPWAVPPIFVNPLVVFSSCQNSSRCCLAPPTQAVAAHNAPPSPVGVIPRCRPCLSYRLKAADSLPFGWPRRQRSAASTRPTYCVRRVPSTKFFCRLCHLGASRRHTQPRPSVHHLSSTSPAPAGIIAPSGCVAALSYPLPKAGQILVF